MASLKSRIEAVLFTTARVLQINDIAEILEVEDVEAVEEAMLDLIMDYGTRDGALEIDDEDGYILQVKEEHMDIVEKLCPVELSKPVLKTLTVIALTTTTRSWGSTICRAGIMIRLSVGLLMKMKLVALILPIAYIHIVKTRQ